MKSAWGTCRQGYQLPQYVGQKPISREKTGSMRQKQCNCMGAICRTLGAFNKACDQHCTHGMRNHKSSSLNYTVSFYRRVQGVHATCGPVLWTRLIIMQANLTDCASSQHVWGPCEKLKKERVMAHSFGRTWEYSLVCDRFSKRMSHGSLFWPSVHLYTPPSAHIVAHRDLLHWCRHPLKAFTTKLQSATWAVVFPDYLQ